MRVKPGSFSRVFMFGKFRPRKKQVINLLFSIRNLKIGHRMNFPNSSLPVFLLGLGSFQGVAGNPTLDHVPLGSFHFHMAPDSTGFFNDSFVDIDV